MPVHNRAPAPQNQNPPASQSASASANSSTPVIVATDPIGIITITQPPQTAVSYYKVAPSQLITFGWNFSSVLSYPSSLTVSAICENGNTYPVGPTNGIIPGKATSVVWDIYSYNQAHSNAPLAQATYTLAIWGDQGPSAAPEPGLLEPNTALQFALYTPEAYTPLASGWQCTGCDVSAALSNYIAHPAFTGLVVTFIIVLLSGFSLIRHTPR